jgi:hypothetical protein
MALNMVEGQTEGGLKNFLKRLASMFVVVRIHASPGYVSQRVSLEPFRKANKIRRFDVANLRRKMTAWKTSRETAAHAAHP